MASQWDPLPSFEELDTYYKYEPETFDLGDCTYTPDFYLPSQDKYVEVKGVWTKKAKRQVKGFMDLGYDLWIIDYHEYAALGFDPEETRYN